MNGFAHQLNFPNSKVENRNIFLPDGSVGLSRKNIFPTAIDSAPNCGVRILDIEVENLNKKKLEFFLYKLSTKINTKEFITSYIKRSELNNALILGLSGISSSNIYENEIDNTDLDGNMINCKAELDKSKIIRFLEKEISFLEKSLMRFRLNTLGTPSTHSINVFLLNLDTNKNILRFTIHTGSGLIGRKLYLNFLSNQENINDGLHKDSAIDQFFAMQTLAGNYGFLNRHLLTKSIVDVCNSEVNILKKPKVINDSPKNYISQESFKNEIYFFHRHGSFKITKEKEYVLLPLKKPYIEGPAYFYKVINCENAINSMSHELGKLELNITEASKNLKIFNGGKSKFVSFLGNADEISDSIYKKFQNITDLKITHKVKPIGIIANFK